MKLGIRLILIFSSIILAGGFFTYILVSNVAQDALKETIGNNQMELARQTMDKIDRSLFDAYQEIQLIAEEESLEHFLSDDNGKMEHEVGEIQRRIEELTMLSGPWEVLFIIDENGDIIFSTDKEEVGKNVNLEENNKIAYERSLEGEVYYSDLIISDDTRRHSIMFSAPIRNEELPGRPVEGVIIGNYAWQSIIEILEDIDISHVHIYQPDGFFIGSNRIEDRDKILNVNEIDRPVIKHALSSEGMSIMIAQSNEDSFEALISHTPQIGFLKYPGNGWTLIFETPTEVAFASVNELKKLIIFVILIVTLSIIISFSFISRSISRPIVKLSEVSEKIGKGDFEIRTGIKRNDELGHLAESIDKMAVDLKELDQRKSDFLNITSHELKTPLTAIFAYLGILDSEKENLSKDQIDAFNAINRNSKQLHSLINNILEMARMESGKFELIKTEINVREKIEQIVDNLRPLAEPHGVKLVSKMGDIPKTIMNDEQRLEEIFNNLISNAIKFTEKGSITIEAETQKRFLLFKVRDTGVGIPENKIKRLFDKFYQVDSSIKRNHEGTGLGLSISKNLVELMGGKMWIKSIVGKGSTFYFTLPIILPPKQQKKEEK